LSKSPLAKDIPLSVPIPVEAAQRRVLQTQGIATTAAANENATNP
jgi:hypothetical protein